MKVSYKLTILCAVALLVIAGAASARAEELNATVGVEATLQTPPPPKNRPAVIKANIENRIEMNKEVRNNLLEKKAEIRKEGKDEMKEMRAEFKQEMKDMRASSTLMFKRAMDAKKMEIKKRMEAREFEIRKAALVRELNHSLEKLADVSTRLQSRITKAESEGRNMTEAKTLFAAAQAKLNKAKIEVAAFAALNASSTVTASSTANASTTAQVDLAKPRQVGDAAIKAVKEAKDAFHKVVLAIAHNMGLKIGQMGTSTPPITSTTTPPVTATTTASTTVTTNP